MAYHIDLHCHSFFSGDGVSSPEELIAAAKRKGLHGFAMTDHNTCDAVAYMIDKGLMRADGQPVDGFLVIPGIEVTTAEGHLLCLGATLPNNLKGTPALEVCHLIHQAGGIAVPPHAYDLFRAGIREDVLDTLPMDGLEVFNAAITFKRHNRRAFEYAQKKGLPMTAGSDAHHEAAIGTVSSCDRRHSSQRSHRRAAQRRHGTQPALSLDEGFAEDVEQLDAAAPSTPPRFRRCKGGINDALLRRIQRLPSWITLATVIDCRYSVCLPFRPL
ncbi:MAG: PHP domain-containing protein [Chthoniobacteraceae bacterium]